MEHLLLNDVLTTANFHPFDAARGALLSDFPTTSDITGQA